MKKNSLWLGLSAALLVGGTLLIAPYGDFRDATVVPHFWWGVSIMGLGFILSWLLDSVSGIWFWGVAISIRVLLLSMYPGDDIWRYLWEGYIQNLGFSPYEFAPNAAELVSYRTVWWSQINHLDTSAIYPPIAQFGFRLLAAISPSVLLFKLSFLGADLLVCWLLSRRFGFLKASFYGWNPLIVYSFIGGAHYDSWFILPLVAAWLFFDGSTVEPQSSNFMQSLREAFADEEEEEEISPIAPPKPPANLRTTRHWLGSAFLIGISAAIKWMSLPILSFLAWQAWHKEGLRQAVLVILCGLLPFVLSAIPFCHGGECPLIPTDSVFVSHGRSAEFIPYLIGQISPASRQVNWIYLIPLGIVGLGLLAKMKDLGSFTEGYFFALLALSPIVHAWYFTWLIPFAILRRNLGTYWVSISAFVYFILPYRQALGSENWRLTPWEMLGLWLPLVLGWLWTMRQDRSLESPRSLG